MNLPLRILGIVSLVIPPVMMFLIRVAPVIFGGLSGRVAALQALRDLIVRDECQ